MINIENFNISLETTFFNNTLVEYAYAIIIFIGLSVAFKVFQWIILKKLSKLANKTKTKIDNTLIDIVKSLKPGFYYFISFFISFQYLNFGETFNKTITAILLIWVIYQIIKAFQLFINYLVETKAKKEENPEAQMALIYIGRIGKWIIWLLGILMVLSNLGIEITSLIAGLGIGGIAIAFALQKILGDLFSSFAIYFDKPFVVGDFIIIGEHLGTVEQIGIKTTRLKSIGGEQIVVSNSELTSSRIQNFGKAKERRAQFTIGVHYDTPIEKLKEIPKIIQKVIEETPNTRFEWAFFKEFGDSALIFEIVFYSLISDYYRYVDIYEKVNFGIKEAFDKEGVKIPYPSRDLYLKEKC